MSVSRQSNASRITPNMKQSSKVMVIKDNKETKDVKSSKINKVNILKPAPSIPFKSLSKLASYSYTKSSSTKNVESKPVKPSVGVSKFVVDVANPKP